MKQRIEQLQRTITCADEMLQSWDRYWKEAAAFLKEHREKPVIPVTQAEIKKLKEEAKAELKKLEKEQTPESCKPNIFKATYDPATSEIQATCCGNQLQLLAKKIQSWRKRKQFRTDWHNVPEKLMLVVTELGEAMEDYRHLEPEFLDTLQHRDLIDPIFHEAEEGKKSTFQWFENFKEEIADTMIRLLDLTASLNINIESEIDKKMAKNELREIKHGKQS